MLMWLSVADTNGIPLDRVLFGTPRLSRLSSLAMATLSLKGKRKRWSQERRRPRALLPNVIYHARFPAGARFHAGAIEDGFSASNMIIRTVPSITRWRRHCRSQRGEKILQCLDPNQGTRAAPICMTDSIDRERLIPDRAAAFRLKIEQ